MYWVYLLWSVIATAVLFALYEPATMENARRFLGQVAVQAVYPRQSTWFLWGLAAFFIAAKTLRRWSLPFVLFALVSSAFSEHVPDLVTSEMVRTLPFFLIGLYAPWLFQEAAGSPNWKRCIILAGLYAAAVVPVLFWRKAPGIWLPATVIGIALLLSVSRLLDRFKGAEVIRYIGRNTLPIYVMHISLLLAVRVLLIERISLDLIGALVFLVIGNVVTIALALGLHVGLKRAGMGWLFRLPDALRTARPSPSRASSLPASPVGAPPAPASPAEARRIAP